jgi:hypothetical protein
VTGPSAGPCDNRRVEALSCSAYHSIIIKLNVLEPFSTSLPTMYVASSLHPVSRGRPSRNHKDVTLPLWFIPKPTPSSPTKPLRTKWKLNNDNADTRTPGHLQHCRLPQLLEALHDAIHVAFAGTICPMTQPSMRYGPERHHGVQSDTSIIALWTKYSRLRTCQ